MRRVHDTRVGRTRVLRPIVQVMGIGATVVLSGCFATQADIQVLQGDLRLIRSESYSADSARKVQLDQVIRSLGLMRDSMNTLVTRMNRFRSDMAGSMSSVEQQLLAIQELTGQSQRKLQEVRASLEERQQTRAMTVDTTSGAGATAAGEGAAPGPNQLFQIAREQMMQGSNSAARTAFQDLIKKYPKADVVPDAQFYIAETYAADGKTAAADSVYSIVVTKYPKSPRAATSLYKRGVAAQTAGKTSAATKIFTDLIKKYPRSDEAALAQDRMQAIDQ